ncbi:UPF0183 protein C16orf70 homolog [Geodia barretti]|uniref:UPF0183 protein C16orf70 homolog n=1 Tax=Geodia barretti TaxID=519541 RepID=A0AA35X936_GEOBA|nr:UPF0183 protein C16orf70 homolog [Geodia barretti]
MLELEVMPERALASSQWELVLGMPLSQVLEVLQLHSGAVQTALLTYSDQKPFEQDLSVDLNQDGVRLYFDPRSQRLKLIEVYDVTKVKMKYCNRFFCSSEITPTVDLINDCFGPTHPGEMDKGHNYYLLHFRGILFAFPLWTAQSGYPSPELGELLEADSYGSLVLSRLCLFSGNITDPAEARAPVMPLECFHGNGYSESVEVVRSEDGKIKGLQLKFIMDEPRSGGVGGEGRLKGLERRVMFGDTPQDVCSSLGAPSKVFFKAEDKMRIHSSGSHKLPTSKCSDYFFNYFTLGLDVLFDCATHRVRKMVMHNNVPGHYNFNM